MINASADLYTNDKSVFRFFSDTHMLTITIYEEDATIGYNCQPCRLTESDMSSIHTNDTMCFKIKGKCTFEKSVDRYGFSDVTCRVQVDSGTTCLEVHLPSFDMKRNEVRIASNHTDMSSELFKVHEFIYDISVLSDSDIQFLFAKDESRLQAYTAVLAYHWNSLDGLQTLGSPEELKTFQLPSFDFKKGISTLKNLFFSIK
ncbi:hypothetical protein CLU79DRAFT_843297 [Phycomyces nitens]|nr:hypothetical protein CLU79DRAFT_843297 [Phycomyces nitens]